MFATTVTASVRVNMAENETGAVAGERPMNSGGLGVRVKHENVDSVAASR